MRPYFLSLTKNFLKQIIKMKTRISFLKRAN
uniref:Uncharacterized protein n=1 Tax=Siphoviridae sp. ctxc31 TaxID=2826520 RepID=A0A8S5MMX3_9CAUD|nr:MAG TPA: hypothetical protein [Siphoviridae sp. ctxc31]